MSADEKAFLISGGTKGIGLAIARRMAAPATQLFLSYRSDEAAAGKARDDLQKSGAKAHLIRQNINSPDAAKLVVDEVARHTKVLNGLVHCAAVPNPGYLATQDIADIHEAIRVGGLALLYLVQPALKLMVEGSSIIFLSGGAIEKALPQHGALALAKAAGECAVRYLALECAPRKIKVNTLRSGPIDTELYRSSRPDGRPPASTPMGQPLTSSDLAEAAALLLAPENGMMTGQIIIVDGGLNVTVRRET